MDDYGASGTCRLVQSIAAGDRRALASLYDLVAPVVHTMARRGVGDERVAELITERVFCRLWRESPRLAGSHLSVCGWLLDATRTETAAWGPVIA